MKEGPQDKEVAIATALKDNAKENWTENQTALKSFLECFKFECPSFASPGRVGWRFPRVKHLGKTKDFSATINDQNFARCKMSSHIQVSFSQWKNDDILHHSCASTSHVAEVVSAYQIGDIADLL